MKKIVLLTLAAATAIPAIADLNGAGFYRVKNYKTGRYVSVVDNRGSIDFVATNADLQAINLNKNYGFVCSDPASVLYVKPVGSEYDISAQGTSVYEIIEHYVSLMQNGSANGQKLYMAYGTYDGVTRYLGDQMTVLDVDMGKMSVTATGDYRKWYILPMTPDGENYYGAAPDVEANVGKHQGMFTTVCASFPMSAYSQGVQFFTVDSYGEWGQVTLKEVAGVVPAGVPVIVKCAGAASSDNRMNVGGEGASVAGNDNLKGVYFCCSKGGHINRVAYDPETMRVLGVCADGTLGFVKAAIDFIPANTAYLTVPAGSPDEFKCVDESEFSGVDSVVGEAEGKTVYTATGIKIGENMTADEVASLPAGLYIINGKKHLLR